MSDGTYAWQDWVRGIPYHAEITALDVGDPLLDPAFWQNELVGVLGFDDPSPDGLQTFLQHQKV